MTEGRSPVSFSGILEMLRVLEDLEDAVSECV
jgi:hypothetical protein